MESVGEFFRHVRETKGLTIDEVASKTRIRTDFLKALEEGNFAKLPDQVFAKGFVRTYARSLGLDEDDAMNRFVQTAGAFYDKQEERERLRLKQAEDERRKRGNRKILALAVGVALMLLILLFTREQSGLVLRRPASEPPPFAVQTPPPVVPPASEPALLPPKSLPVPDEAAVEEESPDGDVEVTEPDTPASRSTASALTEPATASASAPIPTEPVREAVVGPPMVLDLEALELTWVVVQVDGGSPHEALLRPGERVTWEGREQFTLTLGNAGGVRVELNGEQKGPFGPSGSVARGIVLKRGG